MDPHTRPPTHSGTHTHLEVSKRASVGHTNVDLRGRFSPAVVAMQEERLGLQPANALSPRRRQVLCSNIARVAAVVIAINVLQRTVLQLGAVIGRPTVAVVVVWAVRSKRNLAVHQLGGDLAHDDDELDGSAGLSCRRAAVRSASVKQHKAAPLRWCADPARQRIRGLFVACRRFVQGGSPKNQKRRASKQARSLASSLAS